MRRKHTYRPATAKHRFWNYLFGKVSNQEQHAFEKQLLNDPFEADALEGLSQLNETEFAADLNLLSQKIATSYRPKATSRNGWLVAATIALVAGIVSVLTLLIPSAPPTLSDNRALPPRQEQVVPAIKPITEEKKEAQPIAVKEKSEVPLEGELISEELEIATPKVVRPEKKLHPAPKAQSGQQGLVMERIDTDKKELSLQKGEKVAAPPVINALLDADLPEQAEQPKRALSGTLRGQKLTDTAPDYDDVIVIKGVVMDKNRDPLPGANVMLKGTSKGAITQMDGSYQLAINQRDSALPIMAGFIGYVSSEKSQGRDSIFFMLEPELLAMDEVVVTGYGTAREQKIVTEDFVPAQPKAGLDAYIQSIERKLEYPASGSGKKETVVLWVTISEQGIITDIAIKRTPGDAYSDEAIKKLRQGPMWLPATQSGVPTEDKVKLKLQFRP